MYHCQDCKQKFEKPLVEEERHSLTNPPFERYAVCPYCFSERIEEIKTLYCRYCGLPLKDGHTAYCDATCRRKGKRLWHQKQTIVRSMGDNKIGHTVLKLNKYNFEHGTNYSYGQFVALILPKLAKSQKAKVKKNDR